MLPQNFNQATLSFDYSRHQVPSEHAVDLLRPESKEILFDAIFDLGSDLGSRPLVAPLQNQTFFACGECPQSGLRLQHQDSGWTAALGGKRSLVAGAKK